MRAVALSEGERYLLQFLSEEEFSQYGECCGSSLDGLIEKGMAELCGEENGDE